MKILKLLLLVGALGSSSCGVFSKEEVEEEVSPTAPRLVGRVASVDKKQGFVLVQGYGEWLLAEGLLLSSVGETGNTATLTASGERMGRYAAADIKAGDVQIGDLVYARPLVSETPSPRIPASSSESEAGIPASEEAG